MIFEPLPMVDAAAQPIAPTEQAWRHRLNGFGSLYYFIKVILKRKRLTPTLHLPICQSLEKDHLKDGKEYPRDHFKSTIACEGLPMWRALPFGTQDEDKLRQLHYDGIFQCAGGIDEFVRWMYKIHNPRRRNLLVSETDKNARKLGTRVRRHFESNAVFRTFYPEILPTSRERWTDCSLQVHIPGQEPNPHGEGTFDFIGVGGALQSNHYDGLLLQDDLVGRKAIESQAVMDKTLEYHQLLVGVFDQDDALHEADELIIGNRWSFSDLNSYVKEHEEWFQWESHSALGGCCDAHPYGIPIFPEEFSVEKLLKLKKRLGSYHFSCQYLNTPSNPEDADFKEEWLQHFVLRKNMLGDYVIQHEVKDGVVLKDIPVDKLRLAIATDPTHSQNAYSGRCRHSIVVVGMSEEGNYYLLDCWAKKCSYDVYFHQLYDMMVRWKLHRVGFETCAGQGLGAYHLQYITNETGYRMTIIPLKGEVELADGTMSHKKECRIRDTLAPLCEFGRFFTQKRFLDFLQEYVRFPKGTYIDILDALAYIPQLLRNPVPRGQMDGLRRINRQMASQMARPYSVGVGYNKTPGGLYIQ